MVVFYCCVHLPCVAFAWNSSLVWWWWSSCIISTCQKWFTWWRNSILLPVSHTCFVTVTMVFWGRVPVRGNELMPKYQAPIPNYLIRLYVIAVVLCQLVIAFGPLHYCKLPYTYCYFPKCIFRLYFTSSSAQITYRLLQFNTTWGGRYSKIAGSSPRQPKVADCHWSS